MSSDRDATCRPMRRFQNGAALALPLTCSFVAAYMVCRLHLQRMEAKRSERASDPAMDPDADPATDHAEAEPRPSGLAELQQLVVEVLAQLSVRDAFLALPAVSRSVRCLYSDVVKEHIRQGILWPMSFPPDPTGPGHFSALEVLFLWSVSGTWRGAPHVLPHRSLTAACRAAATRGAPGGETAGGTPTSAPVKWALQQSGWNQEGAKILRNIFQWKANPDELDVNRWTPLIWAAHRGSVSVCRELLHARANPDHIGAEGSSALSVACRSAHRWTVQLLLMEGASPFLVPIGNGNFDHHVGEEILEMVRQYRHMSPKKDAFVMCSRS